MPQFLVYKPQHSREGIAIHLSATAASWGRKRLALFSSLRIGGHGVQSDGVLPFDAFAEYLQIDCRSGRHRTNGEAKGSAIDLLPVECYNDIVLLQTGFRGRTIRHNFGNDGSFRCMDSE